MPGRLLSLNHYRRTLIALAVLLTLLALSFLAQTARANFPPPGYQEVRYFYSDASKTQQVGWWFFDCQQELHTWGYQTGYIDQRRDPCE
ncbi:MAG TPA: DUF6289 family protein [Herpetosiphonaceae bacterium]